jgi:GNAT superfamily N-acetyltransferase
MGGAPVGFQFEEIIEPKGDKRLADFSTGSVERWELQVNELVKSLYQNGKRDRHGIAVPELFVFGMLEEAGLVGLCSWMAKAVVVAGGGQGEDGYDAPPPYIHLMGVDETHRGQGLGDNLLLASLEAISQQWTGPRIPEIWGLVDRENEDCRGLVARHGFKCIEKLVGDDRWVRPAGLMVF